MKYIVAVSSSNDECTLNNRAWVDNGVNRAVAQAYVETCIRETGCFMLLRIVEIVVENEVSNTP